ncbi:menaquinone-dependent protoporphyrinogen IX dehydrogenase [Salegentibacter sp. F14]
MEKKVGIIYSGVDGQTKKISEALLYQLQRLQVDVILYSIENFHEKVMDFDLLIIGAGVRYGKHNVQVRRFVLNHKESLNKVTTAFFSVNLVARKKDKNSSSTNPYLINFLKEVNWKPDMLAVFAGRLDYRLYSFLDRIMIKLIMKFTNGPTRNDTAIEYTDWERVRSFGKLVLMKLEEDFNWK